MLSPASRLDCRDDLMRSDGAPLSGWRAKSIETFVKIAFACAQKNRHRPLQGASDHAPPSSARYCASSRTLVARRWFVADRRRRRAGRRTRAGQDRLCDLPYRPGRRAVRHPGHNGAELLVEALNAGKVPAPYNKSGSAAPRSRRNSSTRPARPPTSSPNFATSSSATRSTRRRLCFVGQLPRGHAGRRGAQGSSPSSTSAARRAFSRKSRATTCSASTRTQPWITSRAARYVLAKFKDISLYSGINQNYAWGQDSWRDFRLTMKVLDPKATVDKELFPKLFAGEYGAEISTLLTSNAQVVHSSFYDGDLEASSIRAAARGLAAHADRADHRRSLDLAACATRFPTAPSSARAGPNALRPRQRIEHLVPQGLRRSLQCAADLSRLRFGAIAARPEDRVGKGQAKKGGARPTTEEVIAAFEGIAFPTPSRRADGDRQRPPGHQRHRLRHLQFQQAEASRRSSTSCAIPPNA